MNNIKKKRHSLAHIMAKAIKEIYPQAKFGTGPAIENGFYYDFDIGEEKVEIGELEKRMKETIKENLSFKKETVSAKEAEEIFKDQPYKLEIIKGLEEVTVYTLDNFKDPCEGPHVEKTGEIAPESFKLTKVAGAYFKGNEENPMLTRVYGIAFETKEELEEYEEKVEEAAKRDHRKLGKELDLFHFSDLVGPGLPLFAPKGTILKEEIQKKVEDICKNYGFQKVSTPHFAKIDLYEISGHKEKFKEELFHVYSGYGHKFVMKPVQCPHHTQIYASKIRSYRDLPIRYMESEKQYRAEKPGEVGGLNRVYAITIEDGHSFCEVEKVKDEIKVMINIIKEFYSSLGLWGNHSVCLSLRDYGHPEKYIGEESDWEKCERILEEVCIEMNLDAKKEEGEAALYGPKIDFMFKDALQKEIQIPTVQIDFATPKKFKLSYINREGKEAPPVMVHRAILGSYERFIALLIEHFGGAFPFWLSPVQVKILTINDSCIDYAKEVQKSLGKIRSEIDSGNNTISKKIREAETEKSPYILVIGEKEKEKGVISVRKRGGEDKGLMSIEEFNEYIKGSK